MKFIHQETIESKKTIQRVRKYMQNIKPTEVSLTEYILNAYKSVRRQMTLTQQARHLKSSSLKTISKWLMHIWMKYIHTMEYSIAMKINTYCHMQKYVLSHKYNVE